MSAQEVRDKRRQKLLDRESNKDQITGKANIAEEKKNNKVGDNSLFVDPAEEQKR